MRKLKNSDQGHMSSMFWSWNFGPDSSAHALNYCAVLHSTQITANLLAKCLPFGQAWC